VNTPQEPDPWQDPPAPADAPPAPSAEPDQATAPPPSTASRVRTTAAWVCIGLCTVLLAILQAFGMRMVQEQYADDTRPGFAALYLGRYATGMDNLMGGMGGQGGIGRSMMAEFDAVSAQSPHPLASEIRSVIVAGEIAPKTLDDRLAYLDDLRREVDSELDQDAGMILSIYGDGYTPNADEKAGLVERHGWFGRIASSYNLPTSDSAYRAPRRSATIVVLGMMAMGGTILIAGFAGLVLLVIAIVLACQRKLRIGMPTGPAAQRCVYLETLALFLLLFIVLQLVFGTVQELTGVNLMLPILVFSALPIFWPLLLGVPWQAFKTDMGLHRGRGVLREVGAGVVGYLAGLPIIAIGIGITYLLSMLAESQADHPLQYELLDGGAYTIFIALAGAVIWAPLVEEAVFRSAFYRHLRQRPGVGGFLLATGLTAFIFAAIHPQGWLGIPALMSIAFVLSGLREWRGSIVPSMTAHAIHNSAVSLVFGIVLFA